MSIASTRTSEWFTTPLKNELDQTIRNSMENDILQLPIAATLENAMEVFGLTDEDAKLASVSRDDVAQMTKEMIEYHNLEPSTEIQSQFLEVRLTSEGLIALKPDNCPKFIPASVLTGCVINTHESYCIISIYYYILMRKYNNRVEKVSRYRYFMDSPDKKKALSNFYKCIQLLVRGVDLSAIKDLELYQWQPEKVLVLLNPRSGKGDAMELYNATINKMLSQACMVPKLVVTSYKGHATDYAMRERLDVYSSVLLVSGDGLYHEFLEGLMERMDRNQACKVPISIVPTGENNTLAGSILKTRDEHTKKKYAAVNCMFAFIKGVSRPSDVLQIRSANAVYYSGLYYTWGNLANIYNNSRSLGFLGKHRLAPWTMLKLLRNKGTFGKVWYRHASAPPDSNLIELQSSCFSVFLICNVSNITFNICACPEVDAGSGHAVLAFVKYPITRRRLWKVLRSVGPNGDHANLREFETIPIQACVFEPRRRDVGGVAILDGEELPQLKEPKVEMGVMPKFCNLKF